MQADDYYVIDEVWVDGAEIEELGSVSQYVHLFGPMWSNHSLSATFSAQITSDGVPYWWLADQGLTNTDWEVSVGIDHDDDGMCSGDEFRAGTDPWLSSSVLQATGLGPVFGNQFTLSWSSESNKCYTLLWCDLNTGTRTALVEHVLSTPPVNIYTTAIESASSGAFTIEVECPE